ncbi:peptidoglycan D,D-transpeptidase FtsI family protein, partial [Candidatus Dependentiae bacterium]
LKKHFNKIFHKIKKNKTKKFLWLERKLSTKRLEWFKKQNIKDIHFINEYQRFYPHPSTATIIGFTDIDNIGISGIELEFNNRLSGLPTIFNIKKDARIGHFYFDKEIIQPGKKGLPVSLTIDSKLQFLVQQELAKTVVDFEAKSGSVLILNPQNGDILCMANYPSFDPNKTKIKNLDLTKNKIVTECYELGSVVKVFSALASLQENVVTPDEEIDCGGKYSYIDKFKVENWKSVGILSFKDVIRYSSNVGIAKVIKRLGPKFYTHLSRLGFGQKTGILFPGERNCFVNPPYKWSRSSLLVMSFGYEIMATLLQLGKAFCVIANGGYDVQPALIKNPMKKHNTFIKKIYNQKAILETKDILENIGKRYSKGLDGYKIMGKTGTARSLKNGKYSNKKHIYSFGGIIEKDDYKRVIITFVKEPKGAKWWASQITAPLFNRVAEKMIINDLMNK